MKRRVAATLMVCLTWEIVTFFTIEEGVLD